MKNRLIVQRKRIIGSDIDLSVLDTRIVILFLRMPSNNEKH